MKIIYEQLKIVHNLDEYMLYRVFNKSQCGRIAGNFQVLKKSKAFTILDMKFCTPKFAEVKNIHLMELLYELVKIYKNKIQIKV